MVSEHALVESAFTYASYGWPVLPLHTPVNGTCSCGRPHCKSPGKHPRTRHGIKEATIDRATIQGWWTRWPGANIGIATGADSGLVALDVDTRHGGDASLARLEQRYGALPTSLQQMTGGGGCHWIFAYPGYLSAFRSNIGKLGVGLDILADGAFIVIAPSHHTSGLSYEWVEPQSPDKIRPAPLPGWFVTLLEELASKSSHASGNSDTEIREGQRNSTLTSLAGAMRRRGMCQVAIEAALLADNRARCVPPLPDDEVGKVAASVARYAPQEARGSSPSQSVSGFHMSPDAPGTPSEHTEERSPVQPSADHETRLPVPPPERGWPNLAEEAYVGLLGEFVKTVAPYSEADPVAILLHTLVGGGNLIGPGPHARVEHLPHPPRLNTVFVGRTASARKGTAWNAPLHLFSNVDEQWSLKRIKSGLSSGEGLIVPVKDGEDRRLLIMESEFASALKVLEREGNTLSPIVRDAWDHGNLSFLEKRDQVAATGAHISIIGHITIDELQRSLAVTERANGFANRFLFALVRRSKLMPSGRGTPPETLQPYFLRFLRTIESARTRGELHRDDEAEALWVEVYPKLEEELPGLTGAMLARGAAQTLRLSLIYSLLDENEVKHPQPAIRAHHLLAALAVWDYCKASVKFIFGDSVGEPVADKLYRAIKEGPQTDTDLNKVLGKHDYGRKDPALVLLTRLNRVHQAMVQTAGRPARWWHEGTLAKCVICVKRGETTGVLNVPFIQRLFRGWRKTR